MAVFTGVSGMFALLNDVSELCPLLVVFVGNELLALLKAPRFLIKPVDAKAAGLGFSSVNIGGVTNGG